MSLYDDAYVLKMVILASSRKWLGDKPGTDRKVGKRAEDYGITEGKEGKCFKKLWTLSLCLELLSNYLKLDCCI